MDLELDFTMNESFSNGSVFNHTLNDTIMRLIIHHHMRKGHLNTDGFTIGLVTLYVPIFLLGFFGNGILFVIICSKHQLRSITNLFLCNLAVADLTGN